MTISVVTRRDTIIRTSSNSCLLFMRTARFMWFAPFWELGRLLHFLPPNKTLVQEEYSFSEKNVSDLHIFWDIKGMELARGTPQVYMQVAKWDGHRRIFGRVTQFLRDDSNTGPCRVSMEFI